MAIKLDHVVFSYPGQAPVLNIDHLHVEEGERLFIRGPSGSGKSTLLNLLSGITTPTSGDVSLLGTRLSSLSGRKRDRFRADHLGVIFQQFNLVPYLSLQENVMLPCWFSEKRKQQAHNSKYCAETLLHQLGVPASLQRKPVTELSVGQQQRVAVARALIGHPEIIIADEPTSALDTDSRDDFLDLLLPLVEQQGSTLVFVSHDQSLASHFHRSYDITANKAS